APVAGRAAAPDGTQAPTDPAHPAEAGPGPRDPGPGTAGCELSRCSAGPRILPVRSGRTIGPQRVERYGVTGRRRRRPHGDDRDVAAPPERSGGAATSRSSPTRGASGAGRPRVRRG